MTLLKPKSPTNHPKKLAKFSVATLPAAADNTGSLVFVSDGGSPDAGTVAFSNGTNWVDVLTGSAVD